MRIDRIILNEWHCFRKVDVDLSRVRVASIIGRLAHQPEKSNGAGKSFFMESVKYAFYDVDREPPSIQRLKATSDTFVELYVTHRGKRARIKRGFKMKRDGSKGAGILEFEIDGEPQGEKVKEIQAAIEQFVGCGEDIYSSTSFFTQGDADQFVRSTPAKRREILASLLGLQEYEEARIQTDRDIAVIESSMAADVQSETLARLSMDQAHRMVLELQDENLEGALAALDHRIEALVALQGDYPESLRNIRSFAEVIGPLSKEAVAARNVAMGCSDAHSAAKAAVARAQERKANRHAALAVEYRARRDRISGIPALEAALAQAQADLKTAEDARAAIATEDKAPWVASERAATSTIGEANAEMRAAESAISKIDTLGATCPTCQQPVADAHRAAHRAEYQGKHAAAVARRNEALKAQEQARAQQARIDGLADSRRTIDLRIASLRPWVASQDSALAAARRASEEHATAVTAASVEMKALDADIAMAESSAATAAVTMRDAEDALLRADDALRVARESIDLGAEPVLSRLYSRLVAAYKEAQVARDRIVDRIRSRAAAKKRFEECQTTLIEVERRTRESRERIEVLRLLSKAFSKSGIPHLIAENVVAEIEKGTVEILEALESPNRIVFRTSTETGHDTIQIEVETPDGIRGIRSFSGGQVTELNLAVRLALGEVLARRAEVAFESVFLDEVMSALDAPARQCFLRVVNLMRRSFSQILVISHHSEIRDVLESCVTVEWHPDGATAEVA